MPTEQNEATTELPTETSGLEVPACPFCGKEVDLSDPDTLYPSGTYWRFEEDLGLRTYHGRQRRIEGDGVCFGMHCPKPAGGCGAKITADSKEEAIAAWSQRATEKALSQTLWARERGVLNQGTADAGFEAHWANVLRGNPDIPSFARALAEAAWNTAAALKGQCEPVAVVSAIHEYSGYESHKTNRLTINPLKGMAESGLKEGDKLYLSPPPHPQDDWLPIASAPKDGTAILVFVPYEDDGEVLVVEWRSVRIHYPDAPDIEAWYVAYSDQDEQGDAIAVEPTHWQPLPARPRNAEFRSATDD